MPFRLPLAVVVATVSALVFSTTGLAEDPSPHQIGDEDLNSTSNSFQETAPQEAAHTIRHWVGQSTNPVNGVTYSYSIVGADPTSEEGSATIGVDIVPVNLTIAGRSFDGSASVAGVLASPLFAEGDYSTTAAASTSGGAKGAGGSLSTGNNDVQLLDAEMRSEFNEVGTSYHLTLQRPQVHAPITIAVPTAFGTTLTSRGGVTIGDVDVTWLQPQVEALTAQLHYLKPNRLAIFLTKDVLAYVDNNPMHCCVLGAHGSIDTTGAAQGEEQDGRQRVQTFVWSSWLTAGFFNPARQWARQDIHGLSHELSEWANDPFGTNTVQPWFSPAAPQYGCNNLLETGDPVLGIGFSQGENPFDQNSFSDGTYHPEDEAFLPWFMRSNPNTTSQPAQDSANGRYTFMGALNPFAFFHQPPPGC
ncbi:MAG: hypothetical protein E6J20_12785 [Chloroflexi bacterium]|nr:MAG: hypothetical protein E6J20_12785 [Chloroflexota bacterium]